MSELAWADLELKDRDALHVAYQYFMSDEADWFIPAMNRRGNYGYLYECGLLDRKSENGVDYYRLTGKGFKTYFNSKGSMPDANLHSRLNDVVNRFPPSANLPGAPDLIECVEHLLRKYNSLLDYVSSSQPPAVIYAKPFEGRIVVWSYPPEQQPLEDLRVQFVDLYNQGYSVWSRYNFSEAHFSLFIFKKESHNART